MSSPSREESCSPKITTEVKDDAVYYNGHQETENSPTPVISPGEEGEKGGGGEEEPPAVQEQSMLIVMTAVNPNDLESPVNQQGQTPVTTTTMSIMLPADEFLISSAQINEHRRRKELGLLDEAASGGNPSSPHSGEEQFLTASAAAHMAELQGDATTASAAAHARAEGGGPEESWRAYYEHPLTAATSAMLNISGASPEDPQTTSMGGFIYEYYKPLQQLPPGDKDALVGLTKVGAPGGASAAAAAAVAAAAALGDLWPNSATNPTSMMTSHKGITTNGLTVGGVSGLLVAPPSSTQQQSLTGATTVTLTTASAAVDYSPSVTPAPSSAPPTGSPRNLDHPHSPRARSASPELHGLFTTSNNPTSVAHLQQLQLLQQYTSIKREPEDLSQPLTSRKHILLQDRDKLITSARNTNESVLVLGRKASNTVVVVKDEFRGADRGDSPHDDTSNGLLLKTPLAMTSSAPSSASPTAVYASQIFANLQAHTPSTGGTSPHHFTEHIQYTTGQQGYAVGNSSPVSRASSGGPSYTLTSATDAYYRDYFAATEPPYQLQRQASAIQYTESTANDAANVSNVATVSSAFVERYVRQSAAYKTSATGSVALTVDLPSPDSGIGTDAITPRDQTAIQQSFDYTELCQAPLLTDPLSQQRSSSAGSVVSATGGSTPGSVTTGGRSRPWHDFGRQNDADKVQIPKVYSQYGFKYHLETPISTSQRREDDRITYINKGQFYGITLEYIPDPEATLKFQTVKSVVMLMFREEKSPEDEIKAWQFWHGRQHSVKQRILDADTKNSVGLVGCIEEISHNAIAVYWNPLESSAKINVAVQCLSTDFSSQKGVKGLPLHLQIDTYEDPRDGPVAHRGYSQIKVFCDKGAERKTRDEERRAAKRKVTATGRKKLDELYHPQQERSEFYAMSDLAKPPVLFSPAEDIDKLTSMELQGFYGHETDSSSLSNGDNVRSHVASSPAGAGGYLLHAKNLHHHPPTPTTLKFHNHFPPEHPATGDKKDVLGEPNAGDSVFSSPSQPPLKRPKLQQVPSPSSLHHPGSQSHHVLGTVPPPLNERVMLYVRQDNEDIYTPLHVVPPSTTGLLHAIESKYKISTSAISNLYRKNRRGIIARLDDDMLRYYCNEDLFVLVFKQIKEDEEAFDVTLCEVDD